MGSRIFEPAKIGLAKALVSILALFASCTSAYSHDIGQEFAGERPQYNPSLPVGDGQVSTSAPQIGYVFSCTNDFRTGGARHFGDWVRENRWYPNEKVVVTGQQPWPNAFFAMAADEYLIIVRMNGLPSNHSTGTFPIAPSDPAYEFDTNPNPIAAQNLEFAIPATPSRADQAGCLRRGMIGFTLNGVALYNALDDAGKDASAHEVQDACGGHPSGRGQYHYHAGSPCIPHVHEDVVIGWAIDGYPIMGYDNENSDGYTNAMLDECHGHAQDIAVDGRRYNYAYRLTAEYPYSIGCYAGVVMRETSQQIRQGLNQRRRSRPTGSNRRSDRRGSE